MFDPTIFDNLKVVLEGAVYDLDFGGKLLITNRTDRIELSTMSRYYAIEFAQSAISTNYTEIILQAPLKDLAAEILESNDTPGCEMKLIFTTPVQNPAVECPRIMKELASIWEQRPHISQTLSFEYGEEPYEYIDRIELDFGRKVDEGQIDDFPDLLRYAVRSLNWLDEREKGL